MLRTATALTALATAALCLAACNQTTSTAPAQAVAAVDNTFNGTKADIMRLAVKAIQSKGWKLDQVNESFGMVSFETSMSLGSWSGIKANLILEEAGRPNLYRVTGTAKQNLQGQQVAAFDIADEAQSVVRAAIAEMRSIQQPR